MTKTQNCSYCEDKAWTGDAIKVPLCLRHFDLLLMANQLLRKQVPITVNNLQRLYDQSPLEIRAALSIKRADIPILIRQMRESGHPFPEAWFPMTPREALAPIQSLPGGSCGHIRDLR